MKKKHVQRFLCTVLAGAMVLGLAACGSKKDTDDKDAQKDTQEEAQDDKQDEEKEDQQQEDESAELTYPLENAAEISYWIGGNRAYYLSSEYTDVSQSPFHTGLEEHTGVTVDWQLLAEGADQAQALNLLMTEEELPTIIYCGMDMSLASEWYEDGAILDLKDLLPKYAPDVWAWLTDPAHESELASITSTNGEIFFVPHAREGEYNLCYTGPMIRKDWLDEQNLEIPTTVEELENVLRVFKEEYGAVASARLSEAGSAGFVASALHYGNAIYPDFYVDDDGQVCLNYMQEGFRTGLETQARWYAEGLIDNDILTMDDNALRTKALSGEMGYSVNRMSQLTNYITDAETEGTGAEWVGIEYMREAEGVATKYIQTASSLLGSMGALVSATSTEEEVITALQWLNYAWTEEGALYWNFGEEGVSYEMVDGQPTWTELVTGDAAGMSQAVYKYSGVTNNHPGIQLSSFVASKNNEEAANSVYKWIENSEAKGYLFPSVTRTAEETEEYTELFNAVFTIGSEEIVKFYTGERSMDEWDDFLGELEELGIDRILELNQIAYDRFVGK